MKKINYSVRAGRIKKIWRKTTARCERSGWTGVSESLNLPADDVVLFEILFYCFFHTEEKYDKDENHCRESDHHICHSGEWKGRAYYSEDG